MKYYANMKQASYRRTDTECFQLYKVPDMAEFMKTVECRYQKGERREKCGVII